jgi:hypothetical protein
MSGNGSQDLYANVVTAGLTHTDNCYYKAAGNLVTYDGTNYTAADVSTFEATCVKTDPLMTLPASGNFTLQGTSPCINTGVDVSLTTDYNSQSIIGLPDMGAYEHQTSIYVDSSITDTNVGSATPDFYLYNPTTFSTTTGTSTVYKTLADINAIGTLAAGDSIYLRKGQTWNETIVPPSAGTALGGQITYTSYGTGAKPILDGTGLSACVSDSLGRGYITLDGLEFANADTDHVDTTPPFGVVHKYWPVAEGSTPNWIIQNCTFTHCGARLYGPNTLVQNNTFHGPQPATSNEGAIIIRGAVSANCSVNGNTIEGFTGRGIWFLEAADTCTANDNTIYDISLGSTYGLGIDFDGYGTPLTGVQTCNGNEIYNCYFGIEFESCLEGSFAERNYIHDMRSAVGDNSHGIVYYNYTSRGGHADDRGDHITAVCAYNIIHQCRYGVFIQDAADIKIHNNTIWLGTDAYSYGVYLGETADAPTLPGAYLHLIEIKNNILRGLNNYYSIYVPHDAAETWETYISDCDYNCVVTTFPFYTLVEGSAHFYSLATLQAASKMLNSFSTDPLIADSTPTSASDFILQVTSPCRDTGVDVGLTTDYASNTVPLGIGFDIGAYEYTTPHYYVDQTLGNDTTGTGTQALPYKTLAKVYAVRATLGPGSTVSLKCGETWRETLIAHQAGSAGLPITYGSYGTGERPIISGAVLCAGTWTLVSGTIYSHAQTVPAAAAARVFLSGNNELTFDSGHYATLDMYEYDWAANKLYVNIGRIPVANEIEYTSLTNCLTVNSDYNVFNGIHFTKANESNIIQYDHAVAYATFDNIVSDYAGKNGLLTRMSATVDADNWTVQNSAFNHNGSPHAAVAAHGLYCQFANDWIIQNCDFIENVTANTLQSFGITAKDMRDCDIRYNYFYGHYGGAIELAENTAANGGIGSQDNDVYYNIAVNNRRFVYSNSDDATVLNSGNKVYNNAAVYYATTPTAYGAITIGDTGLVDLDVQNNIFWYNSGKVFNIASGADIATSDYNCLGPQAANFITWEGTNYSTLAAFVAAVATCDANSFVTDPMLQSNTPSGADEFELKVGSPCIDTGAIFGYVLDYFGNTVPENTNPDIGVYEMEYSGGGEEPPPDYSGDYGYWGIWNRWRIWRGEWK